MTSIIPYTNTEEKLSKIEEESLIALRALIDVSGDPLLINNKAESTDYYLLMFLRCRKYNAASAFTKLQGMIHARKVSHRDVFDALLPSAFYKVFDTRGGGVLKNRDAHGRHIIYLKVSAWDTDKINVEEVIKAIVLIAIEMLHHKETQLNGVVGIIDTRGFGFKMAKQANPLLIYKYLNLYLTVNPLKIKAIHICYGSRIFNATLSFVKKFLPMKLKKRINVHGNDLGSLHQFISPEILPDVFGGKLTETEAVDEDFRTNMYTSEREDYYKSLIQNCESLNL